MRNVFLIHQDNAGGANNDAIASRHLVFLAVRHSDYKGNALSNGRFKHVTRHDEEHPSGSDPRNSFRQSVTSAQSAVKNLFTHASASSLSRSAPSSCRVSTASR